jgi:hypothetical protein
MAFNLSTFVKLCGAVALRGHLQARGVALAERIDLEADDAALARLFREAWPKLAESEIRELSRDFDRADAFAGEDAQRVLRTSCLPYREAIAELERWSSDRARTLKIHRAEPVCDSYISCRVAPIPRSTAGAGSRSVSTSFQRAPTGACTTFGEPPQRAHGTARFRSASRRAGAQSCHFDGGTAFEGLSALRL